MLHMRALNACVMSQLERALIYPLCAHALLTVDPLNMEPEFHLICFVT